MSLAKRSAPTPRPPAENGTAGTAPERPAAATLLGLHGIGKRFGGVAAARSVTLDVTEGETHALIGPNGAGKTTLAALICGEIAPDEGRIVFAGRDVTRAPVHARALQGIARSYQITSVFEDMTAAENVALAAQAREGHSFRFWSRARDDLGLREKALAALETVRLLARRDDPAHALSHGEQRQLEIAMAIATGPMLLLLDEPTAGMGPEESARMVEVLAKLKGETSMLLVEHDMDAVFALADRISVLVDGGVVATGEPEDIRGNERVRRAYLGEEGA